MKDLEKHSQLLKCLHESKDKAKHVLQLDSSYLAVKNKSGETVFHYLVIEKEKELAEFLLSLGLSLQKIRWKTSIGGCKKLNFAHFSVNDINFLMTNYHN